MNLKKEIIKKPDWMRATEKQLRFYACRELHIQDIQEEFIKLDLGLDIAPSTSTMSHTPIQRTNNSSSVERYVLRKEESKEILERRLRAVKLIIHKTRKALKELSLEEYTVISFNYFRLCHTYDEPIAKRLGMEIEEYKLIRERALRVLADRLI